MNYKVIGLIILFFIYSMPSTGAVWADTGYSYRATMIVPNDYRPIQIPVTVSNSVGNNNATNLFCNGHCNDNFSDIRFYLDNTTLLSHYVEDNQTGVVWVNVTSNGTVNMYYGNSVATTISNGNSTFQLFDHFEGASLNTNLWRSVGTVSLTFSNSNITILAASGGGGATGYISSLKQFNASHSIRMKHHDYKLAENFVVMAEYGFLTTYATDNSIIRTSTINQFDLYNCVSGVCAASATYVGDTNWHVIDLNRSAATSKQSIDGTITLSNAADIPTINLNVTAGRFWSDANYRGSKQDIDYIFVYRQGAQATWGQQEGYLINSNWNNYTNDNKVTFTLASPSYIFFNVTNTSSVNFFSWFLNGVNQSINANGTSFSISNAGLNNVTIIGENSTGAKSSVTWFVTVPFALLTPANGSVQTSLYPPLDTPINFSWSSLGYPYYELIISRTPDFSMIISDTYVTTTNKNVSLAGGNYWWKVRSYNADTLTWGAYSGTFNFTLTITSSATGRGIDGVVYELVSGVYTPIDQVTVYIYNTTWSSLVVTGTNGYYLFSPLGNGTYNIYAAKSGYDTTTVFPVTVNGSITTNDILMKIYISPYVPNFVFEKFIVRDLFDRSFVGVTTNVHKDDSPIVSFTGTTDSTGSVVFQLIKDQRYKVTFSGGGISGTITVYVYAKEESYYVRVLSGFPTGGDRYTDILTNLTSIPFDATTTNLTLIYNDTKGSTSLVNFYVLNLSTKATCYQSNTSNVFSLSCNVPMSGTYQFGFNATSSIYGFFEEDRIINFDIEKHVTSDVETKIGSGSGELLQWGSIILLVLVGALFSVRSVKYGAVIIPLLALGLYAMRWFEPIVGGGILANTTILASATVLGIMIYLRSSEIKLNF